MENSSKNPCSRAADAVTQHQPTGYFVSKFAGILLDRTAEDEILFSKTYFSKTQHIVCENVNTHNIHEWESDGKWQPQCDWTLKGTIRRLTFLVFWSVIKCKNLFGGKTVKGIIHRDMLQLCLNALPTTAAAATTTTTTTTTTPRSTVLKELTSSQLVKKFPPFYGTWGFITTFTKAHHLFLFWGRSVHATTSQFLKIHFKIILLSTTPECSGYLKEKQMSYFSMTELHDTTTMRWQYSWSGSCPNGGSADGVQSLASAISTSDFLQLVLWGFVRDDVYVSPILVGPNILKDRIRRTTSETKNLSAKCAAQSLMWSDICRETNGTRTELA